MSKETDCSICRLERTQQGKGEDHLCHSCLLIAQDGPYIPNKFPKFERISNIVLSLLLLSYGAAGVYFNELYVPGKFGNGVTFTDISALIIFTAFICGALVMFSVVVDHYDERDNEKYYRYFAKGIKYLGWSLFIVAVFWQ